MAALSIDSVRDEARLEKIRVAADRRAIAATLISRELRSVWDSMVHRRKELAWDSDVRYITRCTLQMHENGKTLMKK